MTGARFLVADRHLARRCHGLALDSEDRHRPVSAIGDERERALARDRDTGRVLAGLERRDDLRRRRLQIDHRHRVVGDPLGRIARIERLVGRHERQRLVGCHRDAEGRADHAAGHVHLGHHLRRPALEVDDRQRVGRRALHGRRNAVDERHLVVIGREQELSVRHGDDDQNHEQGDDGGEPQRVHRVSSRCIDRGACGSAADRRSGSVDERKVHCTA